MAKHYIDLEEYEDITMIVDAWFEEKGLRTLVKYKMVGEVSMLKLMDIKFLSEDIEQAVGCSLVIVINPHLCEKLDMDTLLMMMNETLNVIGFDFNKGKAKKLKNDYETSLLFQEQVGVDNLVKNKKVLMEVVDSYKEELKAKK